MDTLPDLNIPETMALGPQNIEIVQNEVINLKLELNEPSSLIDRPEIIPDD